MESGAQGRGKMHALRMIRVRTEDILPGICAERAEADVQLLAASIARHGLLQPIAVRYDRGKYRLVSGARRLAACRLLGWREIDVFLLEADEAEAVACFLEVHETVRSPGVLDEAQMILAAGVAQVAAHSMLGTSAIERRISLLSLHEKTKHIVRRRGLSLEQALPLLLVHDPQLQLEMAMAAAERDLTPGQVRRLARSPLEERNRACRGRRRAIRLAIEEAKRIAENLRDMGEEASVNVQPQAGGLCVQIHISRKENCVPGCVAGEAPQSFLVCDRNAALPESFT